VGDNLGLRVGDLGKRSVPARFELARHETISGIRCVILTEGTIGCVARSFKVAPKRRGSCRLILSGGEQLALILAAAERDQVKATVGSIWFTSDLIVAPNPPAVETPRPENPEVATLIAAGAPGTVT